jgi:hypothetical protein
MKLELLSPNTAIEFMVQSKLEVMLYIQNYAFAITYGSYTKPNAYYVQVGHPDLATEINEFGSIKDVMSFIRNIAPDGDIEMEVLP